MRACMRVCTVCIGSRLSVVGDCVMDNGTVNELKYVGILIHRVCGFGSSIHNDAHDNLFPEVWIGEFMTHILNVCSKCL